MDRADEISAVLRAPAYGQLRARRGDRAVAGTVGTAIGVYVYGPDGQCIRADDAPGERLDDRIVKLRRRPFQGLTRWSVPELQRPNQSGAGVVAAQREERMMRSSTLVVVGLIGVGVVAGLRADPVGGPQIQAFKVPAAKGEVGEADLVVRVEGGKRRVIVVGDHNPVADLEILVFEVTEKGIDGKQVAHDGGPEQGDRVGVVWYPPRTGNYRIVVRNPATRVQAKPVLQGDDFDSLSRSVQHADDVDLIVESEVAAMLHDGFLPRPA